MSFGCEKMITSDPGQVGQLKSFPEVPVGEGGALCFSGDSALPFSPCPGSQAEVPGEGKGGHRLHLALEFSHGGQWRGPNGGGLSGSTESCFAAWRCVWRFPGQLGAGFVTLGKSVHLSGSPRSLEPVSSHRGLLGHTPVHGG